MTRTGEPVRVSRSGIATCERADLKAWAQQGGPLPMTLSEHILDCSACADRVRRVSEVSAGLMLLCTQTPPLDLTARANGRALRFLRKAARASTAAQRLLRMRPHLTPWQRASVHMARLSVGAAAALLTLLMRTGVLSGFEQTRQLGEQLAQRHWERQIDPTGEWMGPRSTT